MEIEISKELLCVIQNCVTIGVNEGIKEAMKQYENKQKNRSKNRYDKRLRNTKLLLKNYRAFIDFESNVIYTANKNAKDIKAGTSDIIQILDEVYNIEDDKLVIESILKSKRRTSIMLQHINNCIDFYEFKAERSENEELKRRLKVIKMLYIDKENVPFKNIGSELFISSKTVARDRDKAVAELSVLFFGVDGINFD